MKSSVTILLIFSITLCCCQQPTKILSQEEAGLIIIDSTFLDTFKKQIKHTSSRYFSSFNTPIEARFFTGGLQIDSIIQSDFHMISWYSIHQDTINLVAHVGKFETEALLIRFLKGKPRVLYFRAPHDVEGSTYFKIAKADAFSHMIEVNPLRYQLKLSDIPDTTNKQIVYGYIDLESGTYYDMRDTTGQAHKVKMKFYFRSQYREFN